MADIKKMIMLPKRPKWDVSNVPCGGIRITETFHDAHVNPTGVHANESEAWKN
jgi:hypothetical protein